MPTEIWLADGSVISVEQGDKLVSRQLDEAALRSPSFARLTTTGNARVWVNPSHVAAFGALDGNGSDQRG